MALFDFVVHVYSTVLFFRLWNGLLCKTNAFWNLILFKLRSIILFCIALLNWSSREIVSRTINKPRSDVFEVEQNFQGRVPSKFATFMKFRHMMKPTCYNNLPIMCEQYFILALSWLWCMSLCPANRSPSQFLPSCNFLILSVFDIFKLFVIRVLLSDRKKGSSGAQKTGVREL